MNLLYRYLVIPVRDLLYPPLCCACGRYLETEGARVCPSCWGSIIRIRDDHPAWTKLQGRFRESGTIRRFTACFLYEEEGPLRELLHLLKYGGMESIGIQLGCDLGTMLPSSMCTADLLLPVPLHAIVQRERGYNQAEAICRGVRQITGLPLESAALRRIRHTASQTRLSLEARRANVAGAFVVDRRRAAGIAGKRVLLIDDVITTGSTVGACAEALLAAGAEEVLAASAAVAR